MLKKIYFFVFILLFSFVNFAFNSNSPIQKGKNKKKTTSTAVKPKIEKPSLITKIDSVSLKNKNTKSEIDSVKVIQENQKLVLHKKNAHASYYHNKFNGKRTANGQIFDNNKYTAAHKKLAFGTKLKVTNETNGKFVIVEVNDRGPFTKSRDIDLSRKAFMDLVDNKNSGSVNVTIEIIEEK